METKQLVEKFINGDIQEDEFNAEVAKLTPEAQEQIKKDADAAMPNALEKLKGIRRGIVKVTEKQVNEDANLTSQLKKENLETAKSQFFAEFGIDKDEDKKIFEDGFKTDSITPVNIIKDLKSFYVAKNPEKYLNLEKEKKTREQNAEEFNSAGAGGNGAGGSDDSTKKIPKEIKDLMEASKKQGKIITVEKAEQLLRLMKSGGHLPKV